MSLVLCLMAKNVEASRRYNRIVDTGKNFLELTAGVDQKNLDP